MVLKCWRIICCDLMLFEIGFQSLLNDRKRPCVVIWCSLKLVFSERPAEVVNVEVVIWCSLKLVFSRWGSSCRRWRLWFDALWNWFSVPSRESVKSARLWFDALWNWFSVTWGRVRRWRCCDLMLFEIGFQSYPDIDWRESCCDLMLFEIGFQ